MKNQLADVQANEPEFKIEIEKVGISNLIIPIFLTQKSGGYQHSTAEVDCYVNLSGDLKGINMSRLPRVIHRYIDRPISSMVIKEIAEKVRVKSEADSCDLTYKFPYFIKKNAPISGEPGIVHYTVTFNGIKSSNEYKFNIGVDTITTNLCPCSKEISIAGAHNQRAHINIICEYGEKDFVWIEDLVNVAESSSSCEIFSVLRREDEKEVTERAYENPAFVEDIVRSCYDKLIKLDNIKNFTVEVTAMESIHTHCAKAKIYSSKE